MTSSTREPTVDELYARHRRALIDYAAPIVGCRARAEDVVQEAFIRFSGRQATEGATTQAPEESPQAPITHPLPYLYRIVRNLALDWVRRPGAAVEAGDPDALSRLPATTATPEQTVLQRDQLRVLAEPLAERRITGVFNLDDPVGALRVAAGTQNARVTKVTPYLVIVDTP